MNKKLSLELREPRYQSRTETSKDASALPSTDVNTPTADAGDLANAELHKDSAYSGHTGITATSGITASTGERFAPDSKRKKTRGGDNGDGTAAIIRRAGQGIESRNAVVVDRLVSVSMSRKTRDVWEALCDEAESAGSFRFKITRRDLKNAAAVGSARTLDDALSFLEGIGKLKVLSNQGDNRGNEYEIVNNPAEIQSDPKQNIVTTLHGVAHKIASGEVIVDQVTLAQLARLTTSISRLVADRGREVLQ